MCKRDDEEILLELGDLFVLFHYSWKHIVLYFSLSNTHFLDRLWIAKYFISFHCLALIAHHIAFNLRLVLSLPWFDHSCHIFAYSPFRMLGMLFFILLLHLSCHSYLFSAHEDIMLDWGVYPAYPLNPEWLRNLINDFLLFLIIKDIKFLHITILIRLINRLNIQSYALRVVWILAVVAIEIADSLSHAVISLPLIYKSLNLVEVHKTDKVYMTISLSI